VPLDQERILREGLRRALRVLRPEGDLDPGAAERVVRVLGAKLRVPAIPHDVVDVEAAGLGCDQLGDDGVVAT